MTTVLLKSTNKRIEWVPCAVCGGFDTDTMFVQEYAGVGFQVLRCRDCGLVYLNPRPSLGGMREFYPDPKADDRGTTIGLRVDPGIRPRVGFRKKYMEFYGTMGRNPRTLDFVCRDGSFLEALRGRFGWQRLYGLDNRPALAKQASERGFGGFCGAIEKAGYPGGFFDLVVMRHTLEHLYEPHTALREVNRILKKGGFLRVEVPNINSLSKLVSGRMWSGFYIPWHLYHFSGATLRRLLEGEGFEVEEMFTLPYPHYMLSPLRRLRFLLPEKKARRGMGKTLDDSVTVGVVLLPLNALAVSLGRGDEIVAVCQKK
jgi:SAM-dependent methyltransferase